MQNLNDVITAFGQLVERFEAEISDLQCQIDQLKFNKSGRTARQRLPAETDSFPECPNGTWEDVQLRLPGFQLQKQRMHYYIQKYEILGGEPSHEEMQKWATVLSTDTPTNAFSLDQTWGISREENYARLWFLRAAKITKCDSKINSMIYLNT